jgi:hypothetical protein
MSFSTGYYRSGETVRFAALARMPDHEEHRKAPYAAEFSDDIRDSCFGVRSSHLYGDTIFQMRTSPN